MIHKLILADNQSVFRTGMARLLAIEDDCRIIGQCDDLPRLLKAVACSSNVTVLFAASLKVELAPFVTLLRETGSSAIAILEDQESVLEYHRAGVRGIVYRDISNAGLLQCVRKVGAGGSYTQPRDVGPLRGMEGDAIADRVRERLTPKELKIVELILQGYKNRDIAEELHNSEQVIKNYMRSIFDKTGVSDRLELALFAMHHKILVIPPAKDLVAFPVSAAG